MHPIVMLELAKGHQAELLEEARLERLARSARAADSSKGSRRDVVADLRALAAVMAALVLMAEGIDAMAR